MGLLATALPGRARGGPDAQSPAYRHAGAESGACPNDPQPHGRGLRRSKGSASEIGWQPVETPGVLTDREKIQRNIRYVILNPVRAGLVDDPLSWPWSTHRDFVGAVVDPWVDEERIRAVLRMDRPGFKTWMHAYVASDDSVTVPRPPSFCRQHRGRTRRPSHSNGSQRQQRRRRAVRRQMSANPRLPESSSSTWRPRWAGPRLQPCRRCAELHSMACERRGAAHPPSTTDRQGSCASETRGFGSTPSTRRSRRRRDASRGEAAIYRESYVLRNGKPT